MIIRLEYIVEYSYTIVDHSAIVYYDIVYYIMGPMGSIVRYSLGLTSRACFKAHDGPALDVLPHSLKH